MESNVQGVYLKAYNKVWEHKNILFAVVSILAATLYILFNVTFANAAGLTLSATIDEKVTSGTNRFSYSNTWSDCGGCNSGAYQNSFKYAFTTGYSTTFTFTGTQAKIYGFKEPAGGIASVSIDGGAAFDVDYYASSQQLVAVVTTPELTQGTHTVKLTVSGRKSQGTSNTINVDKAEVYTGSSSSDTTKPTVSLTSPSSATTVSTGASVSLAATATDNVGVTKVDFLVNNAVVSSDTTSPYTASWSSTTAGTYTVAARAYDAAGNYTTSSSQTVTVQNSTTTNPTLSATINDRVLSGTNYFSYGGSSWVNCLGCGTAPSYQNGYTYGYTTNDTATFTFVGTQAKIYGMKEPAGGIASVSVDGGAGIDVDFYNASQVAANVFSTQVLPQGTHTVKFTVTGRKNLGTSPTISFDKAEVFTGGTATPDTTAPSVSLTAPANNATVAPNANVTLTASASDNIGVAKVEFYANGTLVGTDTTAPYSITWSTSGIATGSSRTLTAKAYDAAGNQTTSPARTVTVVANTWISGGSGDGIATGAFGSWRGTPVTSCTTWSDVSPDAQKNAYQFWGPKKQQPKNGDYWAWTGSCDWAPGAIFKTLGESWAQAAAGAYDDRWVKAVQNVRSFWEGQDNEAGQRGTLYIRFAHEMNGPGFQKDWGVYANEVSDFKAAYIRFVNIVRTYFPNAKIAFGTNADTNIDSGAYYDWRTLWPGDQYVDVYSTDWYSNHYAAWGIGNTVDSFGAPRGLEAHRQFAAAHGKPFVVSEWAVNGNDSQNGNAQFGPQYVQAMYDFFSANGGTGAGQLLYEHYYDIGNFSIYADPSASTNRPLSAQKYRDLF